MNDSIGLGTYHALSRKTPVTDYTPVSARPQGELVWIHAGEPGSGRAKSDLAKEMIRSRSGLDVLLTTDRPKQVPPVKGLIVEPIPSDHPETVNAFMSHWAPDVVLWVWGGLRPNLLLAAWKQGSALYLINAGQDGFDLKENQWLPEVPRRLLAHFDGWYGRSEAACQRLVQLGCAEDRVEEMPPLQPVGQTVPFAQSDLEDLRETLMGRPIWFARCVTVAELGIVLAAHNMSLKHAPRMLLILEAAAGADKEAVLEAFRDHKLRHTDWNEGEMPNESAQILFVDAPGDTGLWYSMASVSFMGQSLDRDGRGCDPYEAAAHGSAILYGPHVEDFLRSYSRLAAAGAARLISDADTLSSSVSRLTAPDQAARMAMAAWDIVTLGAEAMDKVIQIANDALDRRAGLTE